MSKTVKFRRDSPTGGSYLDHQRSDSGVGSFSSDNESRTAYPDRGSYVGSDYDDPNQYSVLAAEKDEWMARATKFNELLITAHKELKETQARMRGLEDHVETLTEENEKLVKQNQALSEKNTLLDEELKDLKDAKRASRRKSNSPPSMSGANPAAVPAEDKNLKLKRNTSRRRSVGRDRETEKADFEKDRERIAQEMDREKRKEERREQERQKDKEMDRLRKRFDTSSRAGAGEESDANSSKTSSKSKSSRRDSYVEPLGPAAPRAQAQVPLSPSARHGTYAPYPNSGGYAPPSGYTPGIPRAPAVHPQVVVSYDGYREDEDGHYHPHPLPSRRQRSPERRERR